MEFNVLLDGFTGFAMLLNDGPKSRVYWTGVWKGGKFIDFVVEHKKLKDKGWVKTNVSIQVYRDYDLFDE